MESVSLPSVQTSSSAVVVLTDLMTDVDALNEAIQKCVWPRVRELSESLVNSGRTLALCHVRNDRKFNPLPVTLKLFNALSDPNLQWDDDIQHQLARSARLFLELSCMKSVKENKKLHPKSGATLREQIDLLLEHAQEAQVGLQYELACCSEALKLMEKIDTGKYFFALLKAICDGNISPIPELLKRVSELIDQRSKGWFFEALYLSWTGPMAREDLALFQSHCKDIANGLNTQEIAQTAVEFFGDIVWHGSPDISLRALEGTPGLISISKPRPKRKFLELKTRMWPVRFRAVQVLTALGTHPNPKIADKSIETLLNCYVQERNKKVRNLLEKLPEQKEIQQRLKTQFEANKVQILEENIKKREKYEKLEKSLQEFEQAFSKNTKTDQTLHPQAAQEADIEQQKQFIEELRQEYLAQQKNTEELHNKLIKGFNHVLDEVFLSQHNSKPEGAEPRHLICPITQVLMKDPVTADDKEIYERAAIEKWLGRNRNSPITNLPISNTLTPNEPLLKEIVAYKCAGLSDSADLFEQAENYLLGRSGYPRYLEGAIRLINQSADLGHPTAQLYMGWLCDPSRENDTNVKSHLQHLSTQTNLYAIERLILFNHRPSYDMINADQSKQWYEKAAQQGNANAQYSLGFCYDKGIGVKQDHRVAAAWYTRASEQNNSSARNNLGLCFWNGHGVDRDPTNAFVLFEMAAKQGYEVSQYNLAVMYAKGQGVEKNPEIAAEWLEKSARQGYAPAQYYLGYFYAKGRGLKQDLMKAADLFKKGAEQDYAPACFNLGVLHYRGEGVPQSYDEAVRWFTRAAQQKLALAQFHLGVCHYKGLGVEKNNDDACKWYKEAADQGNAYAQYNLAQCYENGEGVEQNYEEAFKLYKMAAEREDVWALFKLGLYYQDGQGTNQNIEEAASCFAKAADKGNAPAQFMLGLCYAKGQGLPQSRKLAVNCFTAAANQGDAKAKFLRIFYSVF